MSAEDGTGRRGKRRRRPKYGNGERRTVRPFRFMSSSRSEPDPRLVDPGPSWVTSGVYTAFSPGAGPVLGCPGLTPSGTGCRCKSSEDRTPIICFKSN